MRVRDLQRPAYGWARCIAFVEAWQMLSCATASLGSRPRFERPGPEPLVESRAEDVFEDLSPTRPSPRDGSAIASDPPCVGDLIDGAYRVTHELGHGGMGVVLCAIDERLQRPVAIKLIRRALLAVGFRERFVREARAMARVNHPSVVGIHAFGEHAGLPYFVMELVAGRPLNFWLAHEPERVALSAKVSILNDICRGLSAIHAAGTIHRDIKPGNILIDRGSRALIADFGISILDSGMSVPHEPVGTPAYMAPEVASSSELARVPTPVSDIYSLACVAFELLVGVAPLTAGSAADLLVKQVSHAPPAPSSLRPELPRSLDHVFARALAKDPADRTADAEAFRRGVVEALLHTPNR